MFAGHMSEKHCNTNIDVLHYCITRNGDMFRLENAPLKAQLNTLSPRQIGRHSVDDIFKRIFLN